MLGGLPQVPTELVEKFARRIGPSLERGGEVRDPDVFCDEFVLAGIGIVDTVDVLFSERRIVCVSQMRPSSRASALAIA